MSALKRIASSLPASLRDDFKRWHFRRQMRAGTFIANEPEIDLISQVVKSGDVVIDVGANVGAYALHMSKCAGPQGRVIAFEPMLETFSHLAAVVKHADAYNITLLNIAASDVHGFAMMDLPNYDGGHSNYYQAAISDSGKYRVMCAPIDSITLPKVKLIKVDAEGHDLNVLKGAQSLIRRDHPVLIVEGTADGDIADWLRDEGYRISRAKDSPNIVGRYKEGAP
jgi:FkbM family methyltransferase